MLVLFTGMEKWEAVFEGKKKSVLVMLSLLSREDVKGRMVHKPGIERNVLG